MAKNIFDGIFYYFSLTVTDHLRDELKKVLDEHGASAAALDDPKLTHFITLSPPTDDILEKIPDNMDVHQVLPSWVERSRILGSLQSPDYHSPEPTHLFAGVTATASDLSPADLELLSAGITSLGGQWRTALTRDVTHVFALAPGSVKYETAMHYRDKTGMRVLVPHWFDDTVRLGIRGLPTSEYEWPMPRVFKPALSDDDAAVDKSYKLSSDRRRFYETALADSFDSKHSSMPARNIWNGLRILLSASLELTQSQRDAHEADIQREGGVIVPLESIGSCSAREIAEEEARKVDEADVLVTRYRAGMSFVKAFKGKKTIGNMTWLWHVRSTGALSMPTDKLLHYPIPREAPEGFERHSITITNYTGKDREYLKKLIQTLGGEFTASMSGKNTVVIAAYMSGTKSTKAHSWSIPVVNHVWLEDCFAQWCALTPAQEKYLCFPPGVDFSGVLAQRGVGEVDYDAHELAVMARAGLEDTVPSRESLPPPGTANSARDAREVEDAMFEEDVAMGEVVDVSIMDVDVDIQPPVEKVNDQMDVHEEESLRPTPALRQGKGKSKMPARAEEDNDEEGAADMARLSSAAKRNSSVRKLVRRDSRQYSSDIQPSVEPEVQDKDEEDEPVSVPVPVKPLKQYKSRSKLNELSQSPIKIGPPKWTAKPRVSLPQEEESEDDRPGPSTKKRKIVASSSEGEEDEADAGLPKEKSPIRRKQAKKLAPVASQDGEVELPKVERRILRNTAKKLEPPAKTDKFKAAPIPTDTEHSGDEQSALPRPTHKKGEPTTPARSSTSPNKPRRRVSVLLPTVAAVYGTPSRHSSQASPAKNTVTRTSSQRAIAAEASAQAPTKRDRPQGGAKHTTESASFQPSADESTSAAASTSHAAGASPALTRIPSKRSAASKAMRKLHDEIMPDVVNFQKEMKKGVVRSVWEAEQGGVKGNGALEDDLSAKGKDRGKKRPSLAAEENLGSEAELPEKKRPRTSMGTASGRKGKQRQREEEESENDDAMDTSKSRRKPESRAKIGSQPATNTSRTNPKNTRIMTTQLSVSDDVQRTLTKMGVKMTTKPTECTHLVTNNVVRTEKFLCAIAVAQHIVNEKWLLASAATKQLLPEEDYMLKDPDAEKKFGFKLSDALSRAKEAKLFAGMTFYVTPRTTVDAKLLRNVVTANSGQVSMQTPTVRVLSGHEHRYVISSPTDVSIWRPLAEHGHTIYTPELILTGALKQQIDWDSPANRVSSSNT